jgi:hypothetical protein
MTTGGGLSHNSPNTIEVHGTAEAPVFIESGDCTGGTLHHIVVLRTSIHDVGHMNVKTDVDNHCVAVDVTRFLPGIAHPREGRPCAS